MPSEVQVRLFLAFSFVTLFLLRFRQSFGVTHSYRYTAVQFSELLLPKRRRVCASLRFHSQIASVRLLRPWLGLGFAPSDSDGVGEDFPP